MRCNRLLVAILVLLALAGAAAAEPELQSVEVILAAAEGVPDTVAAEEATVRLTPVGLRGEAAGEVREAPIVVPGAATLKLPPGATWDAVLVAENWWAAPAAITPGAVAEPVAMTVWPLVPVTGRVKVPDREKPPASLRIRFQGSGEVERRRIGGESSPVFTMVLQEKDPRGEVVCPVDENVFACRAPADTLDLRLQAGGFASVLLWRRELKVGVETDLGTITLVPGGSLLGRVATVEGPADPDSCTITLVPAPAQEPVPPTAEELAARAARRRQTRPDQHGTFIFDGLPSGNYLVEAGQPGFVRTSAGPLPVFEREETELQRGIVLERPVDLHIQVSPPAAPDGASWRLSGTPLEGAAVPEPLFHVTANPDGTVTVPGLPPGRMEVSVHHERASVHRREFELVASSPYLFLEVSQVEVCGTVLEGEEPIPGEVYFGGVGAREGAYFEADEEGRFQGVVPRAGEWNVRVINHELDIDAVVRGVEVRERSGRCDEVELQIPGARVHGTVVDEHSQPVSGALVFLLDEGKERLARRTSDRDGAFSFRGVTPGQALAWAELNEPEPPRKSPNQPVTVPEEGEVGPVILRIAAGREVTGIVLGDGNPVAGARVTFVTKWWDLIGVESDTTGTDRAGRFSVRVPAGATQALVTVAPLPYALTVRVVELPEAGDIILPVTAAGGTLEVAVLEPAGADPPPEGRPQSWWLLWVDGLPVGPNELAGWARQFGIPPGSLNSGASIPQVAPGTYRACLFHRPEETYAALAGVVPPHVPCDSGLLPPRGLLRLELKEPAQP